MKAMRSELGVVPVVADALDSDQVAEAVPRAEPDVMPGVTATAERELGWWPAYPSGPQALVAA